MLPSQADPKTLSWLDFVLWINHHQVPPAKTGTSAYGWTLARTAPYSYLQDIKLIDNIDVHVHATNKYEWINMTNYF